MLQAPLGGPARASPPCFQQPELNSRISSLQGGSHREVQGYVTVPLQQIPTLSYGLESLTPVAEPLP